MTTDEDLLSMKVETLKRVINKMAIFQQTKPAWCYDERISFLALPFFTCLLTCECLPHARNGTSTLVTQVGGSRYQEGPDPLLLERNPTTAHFAGHFFLWKA